MKALILIFLFGSAQAAMVKGPAVVPQKKFDICKYVPKGKTPQEKARFAMAKKKAGCK